jgi:hypothetical protein
MASMSYSKRVIHLEKKLNKKKKKRKPELLN